MNQKMVRKYQGIAKKLSLLGLKDSLKGCFDAAESENSEFYYALSDIFQTELNRRLV